VSYLAELARLTQVADDAANRYSTLRSRANRDAWDAVLEVVRPLNEVHKDRIHRRREVSDDEFAQVQRDVLTQVLERGFIVVPVNPQVPGTAYRIEDPAPARAVEEALRESARARSEAQTYERRFATEIAAEEAAKEAGRRRAKLREDVLDAVPELRTEPDGGIPAGSIRAQQRAGAPPVPR
jgi:hypothetical protein